MASRKISELTALTAPASADVLPIVDVSEALPENQNKKITYAELLSSAPAGTAAAPGFAFDGDTNTGIYSPGADQVAISTGGTGRLFVDASGNVGVGSTASSTAARLLDVDGGALQPTFQLRASSATSATTAYTLDAVNSLVSFISSDWPIRYFINGSERLRITSAGLVGIGTSSVNDLLHLRNGSSFAIRLDDTSNTHFIAAITSPDNFGNGTTAGQLYLRGAAGIGFSGNGGTSIGMVVDSSNRVGIGTTTVNTTLEVLNSSTPIIRVGDGIRHVQLWGGSSTQNQAVGTATAASFGFNINSSEVARFDTSGRLLVGTSSARSNLFGGGTAPQLQVEGTSFAQTTFSIVRNENISTSVPGIVLGKTRGASNGANTVVQSGDNLGLIDFQGADGTNLVTAARISADVDATPGANDMPGRLVFSTTADGASSPTERMRITNDGGIQIGQQTTAFPASNNTVGIGISPVGCLNSMRDGNPAMELGRKNSDGEVAGFFRDATKVGTISVTTTATAYNTSSDYRLKENVIPVTDGITRLQQLKPSRFNFIADPDKTVDGFIAHEVQDVVPEAITGEKDAVDDDGNPVYQGIDQSKLVPLLTAALQEAIGEIESLKARLDAANL